MSKRLSYADILKKKSQETKSKKIIIEKKAYTFKLFSSMTYQDFLYTSLKKERVKCNQNIDRNNPSPVKREMIMYVNEDSDDDDEQDVIDEYILGIYVPVSCHVQPKFYHDRVEHNWVEYNTFLNISLKRVDKSEHSYWKLYFDKINTLWKKKWIYIHHIETQQNLITIET